MVKIEQIGTNVIKKTVRFDGIGKIIMGPNVCISHDAYIESHTHDFTAEDWPTGDKPHTLTLEGWVYIGPRALILGGCRRIAEGVLIGGGAVVPHDITEPWTVWAGNPARKIKDRVVVKTDFSKFPIKRVVKQSEYSLPSIEE